MDEDSGIPAWVSADAKMALADAWASIDGKLSQFRRGHDAKTILAFGGHYAGYESEAEEMIIRLERRGFRIVPVSPP